MNRHQLAQSMKRHRIRSTIAIWFLLTVGAGILGASPDIGTPAAIAAITIVYYAPIRQRLTRLLRTPTRLLIAALLIAPAVPEPIKSLVIVAALLNIAKTITTTIRNNQKAATMETVTVRR